MLTFGTSLLCLGWMLSTRFSESSQVCISQENVSCAIRQLERNRFKRVVIKCPTDVITEALSLLNTTSFFFFLITEKSVCIWKTRCGKLFGVGTLWVWACFTTLGENWDILFGQTRHPRRLMKLCERRQSSGRNLAYLWRLYHTNIIIVVVTSFPPLILKMFG